ncbi:MAG: glycogen debranching enzyme N-terminal domain-containing protein, partial [Planctomycetes bacterium]|nr:glycogen debranching enzyme N-terminal domain-containing protein [Planctomycetota bacterium]
MLSYISHFFKSKILPAIQTDNNINTSLEIINNSVEDLLNKEWLLTNNRGGYASSTTIGCNTRRYHGLLIGSPNPPANRIMALGNILETIQTGS